MAIGGAGGGRPPGNNGQRVYQGRSNVVSPAEDAPQAIQPIQPIAVVPQGIQPIQPIAVVPQGAQPVQPAAVAPQVVHVIEAAELIQPADAEPR